MESAHALSSLDGIVVILVAPVQLVVVTAGQDVGNLVLVEGPRVHVGVETQGIDGAKAQECLTGLPRLTGVNPALGHRLEALVSGRSVELLHLGIEHVGILRQRLIRGQHHSVDIVGNDGVEHLVRVDVGVALDV